MHAQGQAGAGAAHGCSAAQRCMAVGLLALLPSQSPSATWLAQCRCRAPHLLPLASPSPHASPLRLAIACRCATPSTPPSGCRWLTATSGTRSTGSMCPTTQCSSGQRWAGGGRVKGVVHVCARVWCALYPSPPSCVPPWVAQGRARPTVQPGPLPLAPLCSRIWRTCSGSRATTPSCNAST